MLQVFDSWAGELSPHHFLEFSLPSIIHISTKVRASLKAAGHPGVPMTLFAKGTHSASVLRAISDPSVTGYDTLSLDWTLDPLDVRAIVGKKVNLQGNFDPVILYGGKAGIQAEVKRLGKIWKQAGGGWIANLGHGITPGVKPEDMGWFLACVRRYSDRTRGEGEEEDREGDWEGCYLDTDKDKDAAVRAELLAQQK